MSSSKKPEKKYVSYGKLKSISLSDHDIKVLQERLAYDETSHTFLRWTDSKLNRSDIRGKPAGNMYYEGDYSNRRRRKIRKVDIVIGGVNYRLSISRVIWSLHTGKDVGTYVIDHKDNKPLNNKISNIRCIDIRYNNINRFVKNSSGYKHVTLAGGTRDGKPLFRLTFKFNGKKYLAKGYFTCPHFAFTKVWEELTSGRLPVELSVYQPISIMDGSMLKKAIEECEKLGTKIEVKYKTLYDYLKDIGYKGDY